MASAKKDPSVNVGKGPSGENLPDFDKWDKIQIGFAPYWHAEEMKFCYGEVIAKDARDPDFIRYLILAHADHDCRRGPQETGEEVKVRKGECFSISSWHSLSQELDYQLFLKEKGHEGIAVRILAEKKVPTSNAGRTVWQFDVRNDPKHTPMLNKHRGEYQRLVAGGEDRPQLGS